jgi:hypothetical protein
MSGFSIVIIILMVVGLGGYMILRKRKGAGGGGGGFLGGLWNKISSTDAKTEIERCKAEAAAEEEKAKVLRELLEARRAVSRAKAENQRLTKAIGAVGDSAAELRAQLPSSKLKH